MPISTALVCSHINARTKYHDRIDNEKREQERARAQIRDELEATRKRKAEEEERSEYLAKVKKFEDEEKKIRDALKFNQTRREGLDQDMSRANISLTEMQSAYALSKQCSKNIEENRANLDELIKKKFKLVKSRANKQK